MLDTLGREHQESTSFTPQHSDCKHGPLYLALFSHRLWTSNSRPHACKMSTLLTKLSPQPCMAFCVCLKMKHIERREKGVQSGTSVRQRDDLPHPCLQ